MKRKKMIWTTIKGEHVKITEMGFEHLMNTIKMLEKKDSLNPDLFSKYIELQDEFRARLKQPGNWFRFMELDKGDGNESKNK